MNTELYWIEGAWPGRLAVMSRPRGGDWLEDEVRAWRRSGVAVVLSLLTGDETAELDLTDEDEHCRANGIHFHSFPITDRGVPASQAAVSETVACLARYLADGTDVAVHCRQGIGRSALVAACLLIRLGHDADAAVARVSAARGCPVPETAEQRQWIADFARTIAEPEKAPLRGGSPYPHVTLEDFRHR